MRSPLVDARVAHRAVPVVVAALAVAALLAVRPGVVLNGVSSPRVWLVVLLVLVGARALRWALLRVTGRPAWAGGTTAVVLAVVVALLLAPSFQQRTVVEADPFAVPAAVARERAPAPAPAPATAPATAAPAPAPPDVPAPTTLSAGELRGLGHRARGAVQVQEQGGTVVLRFVEVDVEGTPGPEVHLVPRGSETPDGGVLLGPLTAERGSFSYVLPEGLDPAGAWAVLVWCRPYDTPVAVAELVGAGA